MLNRSTPSPSLKVAVIVPGKRIKCLGAHLWIQRYGPLQVVQVANEAGYHVRLFNEEIGCRIHPQTIAATFDVVGVSAKTCAISRAEEIVCRIQDAARRMRRSIVFVLGGEHASMSHGGRIPAPFDVVLPGESEAAFVHLLDRLQAGSAGKAGLRATRSGCGFHQCAAFDQIPDYQRVDGYQRTVSRWSFRKIPWLWAVRHRQIPYLSFQGSRGCPYNCSFCPTPTSLQGRRYRRRRIDSALRYLNLHVTQQGIRRVFFEDPTAAMAFDRDAHRFFDAIARNRLAIRATALVRMDLCEDTDLLQTMRDAGVCNLSVGIESVREETLTAFRKKTSPGLLAKAIDTFHRYGFSVTGLFIVGYDTEGLESLDRIRDFIDHTGIAKWRVSPLCQTPEVSGQFLPPHRIFTWDELQPFGRETADFMNGEYVFFFPRHIRPSDLQRGILRFNRKMCAWPALVRLWGARRRFWPLILRVGNNFAQRWVQQQVLASRYIQMLETIERPFYERTARGWALKEGRLERRYVKTANRHRNHCRHGTMDAAAQRLTAVP